MLDRPDSRKKTVVEGTAHVEKGERIEGSLSEREREEKEKNGQKEEKDKG